MRKDKEPSILKKFVGNTGWMMFRNIYSMLVSLIVGSLSARFLGPSNYGLLTYGSAIIAFFTTVSKLGMDSVVVAEIVRYPKKENVFLGTALLMRFVASVLSFFAIWGFVLVFEPENRSLQIVTVLQATAIIFQSTEVFYFWFQAKMEMKYVTLTAMAALTVTSIWRLALLAGKASVQWFALSASISAMVCGICIGIIFSKKSGIRLKFCWEEGKAVLRKSYHFIINGLAVTLYMQLDRIMVGKLSSETAVGLYGAASTLAVMWQFVPLNIIDSSNPILLKMYDTDKRKYESRYQMLLMGITAMGIAVGFGFTIFSRLIIYILYGEAYFEAAPALAILIWATCFSMIGTARSTWIIATGRNKFSKYFTCMGAVLNTVLNAVIIPRWGFVGASATTLATEMFVSLAAPLFFSETREFTFLYFGGFRKIPEFVHTLKGYLQMRR